jgi:hypothetical protein
VTSWASMLPARLGAEPFQEYVQPEHVLPFSQVIDGAIEIVNRVSAVDVSDVHARDRRPGGGDPTLRREMGRHLPKLYLQSMRPELDKYWGGLPGRTGPRVR